ncbi:unnamed protein product [Lactuca virosa]|uniref:Uncharacterized protein n=1 Tax=Lactuca virosa TaxID=75947 RepID=A0AAU9N688_9ASTR|nr:unnamed protein product [Lactuca virosa]
MFFWRLMILHFPHIIVRGLWIHDFTTYGFVLSNSRKPTQSQKLPSPFEATTLLGWIFLLISYLLMGRSSVDSTSGFSG